MAIFKCKMCGGDLNITADEKIVECEYCGTSQTVPNGEDEKKINLFNRANRLRMESEFDKAAGVYESIVSEFPEESEGYWGLVLCTYGIEYVDDKKTGKKIPTCHRTVTSPVMDNDNFEKACEYADMDSRRVYREEAKQIDGLQKKIISVVETEEPYDIFICYKETDDVSKKRTEDSLIAQDIYTELIKEGYKVFFSRVTLRDKAGTEYEPYIYAALKSANVMLAIGTKYEYYDAVWVKNEWSRYISMMEEDSEKHLIPCFKDLDAYDIPKEFKNLQALDMGEVTFFKNLTDNVKRLMPKKEQITVVEKIAESGSANIGIAPLLKRMFMFLEDGAWESADEYAEKVLDQEPECAEAYLGKLMAELYVRKREALKELAEPFDGNSNYQKAFRFGSDALKAGISGYVDFINARNESLRKEAERRTEIKRKKVEARAKVIRKIAMIAIPIVCVVVAFIISLNTVIWPNIKYNQAVKNMNAGKFEKAISMFEALDGYKDSINKVEECNINIYGEEVWNKIKSVNIGDTYRFGSYEQDNNKYNGKEDIEWLVLSKEGTKFLVISKYALDCKQYNTAYKGVTWETCTLRKWLNNDFINNAFSADEKAMIPTVTVSADKNPEYSTNPGNATEDKVFLLSITEAEKYFSSDTARQCQPTDYAVVGGAYVNRSSGNCLWWLRSPGFNLSKATNVDDDGDIDDYNKVDYVNRAVRPAMWIEIKE